MFLDWLPVINLAKPRTARMRGSADFSPGTPPFTD